MQAIIILFLMGVLAAMGSGDGFPNSEDEPIPLPGTGDIIGTGADQSAIRLVDSVSGGGLFTTNSDPNVVGVDPLTGEDAPLGTDVGFGAAIRRFIHTGVLNGDFSLPPPSTDQPIDDSNPLPYWTWTGGDAAEIVADATLASGRKLRVTDVLSAGSTMAQLVSVPRSQGQQYRALLSVYMVTAEALSADAVRYQYLAADGVTTIGSEVEVTSLAVEEVKIDAGLVPATASYLRVSLYANKSVGGVREYGEVRVAFLPAEATLGLRSIVGASGAITNTQTQVAAITVPAGSFTKGSVYRITATGVLTSSAANAVTFRVRVGPTTLTGNIAAAVAPTATTTASGNGFRIDALITIRSVGAGGSVIGSITAAGTGPAIQQPFTDALRTGVEAATVAVDTTVANLVELTAVTAAGTTSVTFHQAVIECVMAS